MRDEDGRSRGYGFVSFYSPTEGNSSFATFCVSFIFDGPMKFADDDPASEAIRQFNGQRFGNQIVAVTLHEPRRLRPEKASGILRPAFAPSMSAKQRQNRSGSPSLLTQKGRHASAPQLSSGKDKVSLLVLLDQRNQSD